ncbi:MAG: hypothetical protein AVDCRST_MAG96-365 [uncultured Segetibacter sp.]|uniref:Uncharacterized protein n=1 Tax=uncultured Segetibacter sp. TaxID=481133 RepID=A0A6J4RCQ7_9BACT|nr:MAG: hypothetical protein AVDCRST_MAG96-365 [uncultured Segetibacter sp.]
MENNQQVYHQLIYLLFLPFFLLFHCSNFNIKREKLFTCPNNFYVLNRRTFEAESYLKLTRESRTKLIEPQPNLW